MCVSRRPLRTQHASHGPLLVTLTCRSYKYQAWQDAKLGRQKVVRDGVETVLTLVPGETSGAHGRADGRQL